MDKRTLTDAELEARLNKYEYSMRLFEIDPQQDISTLNNIGPDIFGNKDKSFDNYLN